ncbi:MAG: uroporphyrinogen-III synthase [Fuerstiella sp.]|nr:uroporphyrinogen-III synthase [Fuerstiella sp.]MCP4513485.1 uroporphyrinogen-III synthase [Fuerstiella sp.]MCP4857722.1 uroporphyrinogen-III synthase [Fuerstiella sp.]
MRSLIERFDGHAMIAPSMQQVPFEENAVALDAIRQVISGAVSHMVLLTGVGTETMLKVAAAQDLEQGLLQSMGRMPLLVRGPKPAAVLQRHGLKFTVKAPEPNTWRELLTAIDEAQIELNNQNVAVQEYGIPNPELCDGLTSRGATVLPIPVYRWALPDDIAPLRQAIRQTIDGEIDALLFTSAQQVRHVLKIAEQMAQRDEWLSSANRTVVGSIGPTCGQTLREEGLVVSVEASPPKMGPLVRAVMQHIADA